jgi:uncharacterized repeat protein (TIGR01451 family)
MGKSLSVTVLFLVLVSAAASAFGQEPKLTGEMVASKIVLDEKSREIAVPADKVYPRDTVEYTLVYRNSGNASAAGVNLVGPIPAGTAYLDQTATDIRGLHPLFSIDGGKTYQEQPVTYIVVNADGEEERMIATPDMITHIRWSLSGILDVDQEVSVSYRVQVE